MGYSFLSSFQVLAFTFSVCPGPCHVQQCREERLTVCMKRNSCICLPVEAARAELSFQHNSKFVQPRWSRDREWGRTLSIGEVSWRPGSCDPVTVLMLTSPARGWPAWTELRCCMALLLLRHHLGGSLHGVADTCPAMTKIATGCCPCHSFPSEASSLLRVSRQHCGQDLG